MNGTLCGAAASICVQGVCENDSLGRQSFSGDRSDLVSGGVLNGIASVWDGFYPWGLAGFYFNFTGSGVDHQLERIKPGFFAFDFSPQPPGPETVLSARYEDENADDAFNWSIDAQELPYGSTRHGFGACSSEGRFLQVIGDIPVDKEPVLLGFDLDRGADWNVETLQARIARTAGNTVSIVLIFEDDGTYNAFCYTVIYALIPSSRVRGTGHILETTSRKGSHTRAIASDRPILQGFKLWFTNGDHHVDQVGLRLLPGELRVWLNDQNNDDPFRWEAWWIDLE